VKKKVEEASPNLLEKSNPYARGAPAVNTYLCPKSQILGSLLGRLQQIKTWQKMLTKALPAEKELFSRCHVVHADAVSLMIIADNPQWATRLRFLVPQLLAALKSFPEYAKLQAIYCKVQPPLYHHHLTGKKRRRQRLTISKISAEQLEMAATKIKDPKISRALKKLAARSSGME